MCELPVSCPRKASVLSVTQTVLMCDQIRLDDCVGEVQCLQQVVSLTALT